jgi:hypothetical protein
VINAVTGEHLKRAQVRLFGQVAVPAIAQPQEGAGSGGYVGSIAGGTNESARLTDADGQFEFTDLPAGQFTLQCERSGFSGHGYAGRTRARPAARVELAAGQTISDVRLQLLPGAVLVGRVVDESGQPMADVDVQALRAMYGIEGRQLMPTGQGRTNDLGEYRIFGLAPGSYYVVAQASQSNDEGESGPSVIRITKVTYASTYFQEARGLSDATKLELRPGEETTANITFSPTPVFNVSGQISGLPPNSTQLPVQLTVYRAGEAVPANLNISRTPIGFEIKHVPSGEYLIQAMVFLDQGKDVREAELPFTVAEDDVTGLHLAVKPRHEPLPVRGTVRIEGEQRDPSTIYVSLQRSSTSVSSPASYGEGGGNGIVQKDGTFSISIRSKGTFYPFLQAAGPGWADYFTKEVRLAGQDVTDSGFDLATAQAGARLEIIVSKNGGTVAGKALTADGSPLKGGTVVAVPETRLRNRHELFTVARTDNNGSYSLRGMRPGEYKLFVWEEIEPESYFDPDILKNFESQAKPVHVAAGAAETVDLVEATGN